MEYNISPHSAHDGLSPYEIWIKQETEGFLPKPNWEIEEFEDYAYKTIPTAKNGVDNIPKYNPSKGIVLSKIWYNYTGDKREVEDKSWIQLYKQKEEIDCHQSKDGV